MSRTYLQLKDILHRVEFLLVSAKFRSAQLQSSMIFLLAFLGFGAASAPWRSSDRFVPRRKLLECLVFVTSASLNSGGAERGVFGQ